MENNELNLRSEEIQDIMERTPSWILRWGISSIFILIVLGIFLTYIVEYPEIIKGPVSITTNHAPIKIVSQSSGNIVHLYVNEGEVVKAGTVLAEIENPTSAKALSNLSAYIQKLEKHLNSGMIDLPLPDTTGIGLGDLQAIVGNLQMEIVNQNVRRKFRIDDSEIGGLAARIANEKELLQINSNMLELAEKDLANAKIKFDSDKKLYEQGVLSKTDFIQLESNFRAKQMQVENQRQAKVQNTMALNSLQQQLAQSGYQKASKQESSNETIRAAIESIRSYIIAWKQQYSLIAPADGKVSYMFHLQPRQFVKAGEALFGIIQSDEKYIAVASVPTAGLGKVKVGQKVYLQLDHFPYYEYGMVEGVVHHIAVLPNGGEYRIEISMPKGMLSSHGEILRYTPEMQGIAEIITEDKRVIERIFESFLKVFQKR